MIDNRLNKVISFLPSSVVETATRHIETGQNYLQNLKKSAENWKKGKDLDFKLVTTWLSFEKLKESTPTLASFTQSLKEKFSYDKLLKNINENEYKIKLQSYITDFYNIAIQSWEELKSCETQKDRFDLMLKVVSENINKNTGIKNFEEMSNVMKEVASKYIEGLDILISKPQYVVQVEKALKKEISGV